LADVPSGPWQVRRPGAGQGPPPPPVDRLPGADGWRTGTWLDEYTPIYLALNTPTRTRGAIPPSEVDRLEIPVVAAMLGIGADPFASQDPRQMAAEVNRKRIAAAEAAQAAAAAEGRHISLAEAEDEAGISWQTIAADR
jgi:hypothetical protein